MKGSRFCALLSAALINVISSQTLAEVENITSNISTSTEIPAMLEEATLTTTEVVALTEAEMKETVGSFFNEDGGWTFRPTPRATIKYRPWPGSVEASITHWKY